MPAADPGLATGLSSEGAPVRLKVRFWGVRGSVPVPGPETLRYGGNTSCVEVRVGRETIILDAGTGLRELGRALLRRPEPEAENLSILISHTHWDHIQGFPFFAPAYQARQSIRIVGRRGSQASLRHTIAAAVESPFFPVALPDMPGHISFQELRRPEFRLGSLRVSTAPLRHPGGGIAFRFASRTGTLAYVPDHEIPCPGPDDPSVLGWPVQSPAMTRLIQGVDLLIHDAQYTPAEYAARRGWGHSCTDAVVRTAAAAGVKWLMLFHHDPERTDRQLDQVVRAARRLGRDLGSPMRIDAAREGLEISLPGRRPRRRGPACG